MFITHRKDLKLDGKNPCYLYAYGGFQINRTPGFRPSAIMFVEQGGVFCEANRAAARSTARHGTRPGCWRTNRTSSTISSRRPST